MDGISHENLSDEDLVAAVTQVDSKQNDDEPGGSTEQVSQTDAVTALDLSLRYLERLCRNAKKTNKVYLVLINNFCSYTQCSHF